MVEIGLIVPPDQPPERILAVAAAAEAAGIPELWLWEDCFAEGGISCATAILAATTRIRVGIGLLPVPLRTVALTAMELAAIARLFPGRLLPGIGHGVQDWMGQAGVRVASPLTLLREYAVALRRLLDGEEVTTSGRYVSLDGVRLRYPLDPGSLPLFVGAEGPRTLALAGEVGDGIIFTGGTSPAQLRAGLDRAYAARRASRDDSPLDPVIFLSVPVDADAGEVASGARQLADAGAHRVAVCALVPEGPPESGERLLEFAATVGRARYPRARG